MKIKFVILVVLLMVPLALQLFGIVNFFDLEYLRANEGRLLEFRQNRPIALMGIFIAVYTLVCASPFPAVALLTLAAGMLFGFGNGLIVVSFSSAVGATLAFWFTRYLGRDLIRTYLGERLETLDREMESAGFLYALSLRFIPGVPFFVANAALAFTSIKTTSFYLSTQIGMLLMLGIFVNAGHNLSVISSPAEILDAKLLVSFALLALVPLLMRLFSAYLKKRTPQEAD